MKILKEYEIHLNLTAAEVYTSAADNNYLLSKIRNLYDGRCLASTLITSILRIIRQSDIYCTKSKNDGSYEMDMVFEAEAIIYNAGNIISDCVIKKVETTGQIICVSDYAVIRLDINRLVQSIGEGGRIPVLVHSSSYTFGKREITVTGETYFHPQREFVLYKLMGDIPAEAKMQFKILEDKIAEEVAWAAGLDKDERKQYDYFASLFYPWKTVKPINDKKLIVASILTCKDDMQINYIAKHPIQDEASGSVLIIPEDVALEGPKHPLLGSDYIVKFIVDKRDKIMYTLLVEYLNYLSMLKEYCTLYNTPEKLKSNQRAWDLYLKRKK